jgi:hypothetical protein
MSGNGNLLTDEIIERQAAHANLRRRHRGGGAYASSSEAPVFSASADAALQRASTEAGALVTSTNSETGATHDAERAELLRTVNALRSKDPLGTFKTSAYKDKTDEQIVDEWLERTRRSPTGDLTSMLPCRKLDLFFLFVLVLAFYLFALAHYKIDLLPIAWKYIGPTYDEGWHDKGKGAGGKQTDADL